MSVSCMAETGHEGSALTRGRWWLLLGTQGPWVRCLPCGRAGQGQDKPLLLHSQAWLGETQEVLEQLGRSA